MVEMGGGGSVHLSDSNPFFRSHRMKPAKWRTKFDKIKWDGLPLSFKEFRRDLEGHLLQVGARYKIENSFIEMYSNWEWITSNLEFSGKGIKF